MSFIFICLFIHQTLTPNSNLTNLTETAFVKFAPILSVFESEDRNPKNHKGFIL